MRGGPASLDLGSRQERRPPHGPPFEVTPKGQKVNAAHVESGQRGGQQRHGIEHRTEPRRRLEGADVAKHPRASQWVDRSVHESAVKDLVLREEAAGQGKPDDGRRGGQERQVGQRKPLPEAAHVADVLCLFVIVNACVHRVDDRTCPKKEAGLEKRVREDVEEAGRKRAHADAEEHEPQLAHRGVREHLFDVVLHERDRGGEKRRGRPDARDEHHREGGENEDERQAANQVDAGGDHRGRVDERGDRRRTRHRVGEPNVERNLRALARATQEEREAHGRRRADGDGPRGL